MNLLLSAAVAVRKFLDAVYNSLTYILQKINIDSHLAIFCKYHLLICIIIFAALLVYFIKYDKKQSFVNFIDPKNFCIAIVLMAAYTFLSSRGINLKNFGLGTVLIQPVILIIIAKLYGPLFAGAFSTLGYILSYLWLMRGGGSATPFMIGLLFVYAIGGMIHGWILYEHKTSFWRCLVARIAGVVLCNIILIPLVRIGVYTHSEPLSVFIPKTLATNMLQIPFQAIIGYAVLRGIKILRGKFEF